MSDTPRREDLETRKKRLRFRSWHRGTKENDLLIGRFVDACLDDLDADALDQFEDLINHAPDVELFLWLTNKKPVPAEFDTPVFRMIQKFNNAG